MRMPPIIAERSLSGGGDVDVSDAFCIRFGDKMGSSIDVAWSDPTGGWVEVSGGFSIEIQPLASNTVRIRVRDR
jgi:hypothetical protein